MHKLFSSLPFRLISIAIGIFIISILLTPSSKMPYRLTVSEMEPHKADIPELPIPLFEEQTVKASIVSQHVQGGEHLSGLNETLGAGACAFDYNDDGWIDILTIGGSGQTRYYGRSEWWQKNRGNSLYKNIGDGRFEDVTQESGLNINAWGMGCATADFDNDGDQDLLLTNLGKNLLFRNNGDSTFTDITSETGLSGDNWSTSAAVADYDNDGLLDIYIVNYIDYSKGARTLEKSSGFRSRVTRTFDHTLYDSQPNRLYHNEGNLKFKDATQSAGVENSSGRGLSALWHDVNTDNHPDLIIANDTGLPNTVYINNKSGTFRDATASFNLNTTTSTRSIAAGDIDNDGDLDILMSSDHVNPIIAYLNNNSPSYSLTNSDDRVTYNDRSRDLGLSNEQQTNLNSWGLSLQDFNNDGWLDLFSANGHIIPAPDNPRIPQGQAKQLWLNQGRGMYSACDTKCGEHLFDIMSARGIAAADYDNDGDIDIYTSHNNDIGQLLINKLNSSNWINLQLEGTSSNRDAIGTIVKIKTAESLQTKIVDGNPTFLSGGDKRLHFGLNTENIVSEMHIKWPNGDVQSFNNISANRFLKIRQGDSNYNEIQLKSSTTQHSKLLFNDPMHKVSSIQWLINANNKKQAERELLLIYKDDDTEIRKKAVNLTNQIDTPATLAILLESLEDKDPENRIGAINALTELESEMSVRWLLRKFNDSDTNVQCAVADSFAFFFREEEAVVNHKYFAVPHLIENLDSNNAKVRACSARALGDAELYRGAPPLIKLIGDENIEVRTQAVRSLGLIRENIASPHLRKIIDDPRQPALVKFHSIVALQRLQYPDIVSVISQSLATATAEMDTNQVYSLIHTLLILVTDDNDGITVRSSAIGKLVYEWLKSTDFTSRNKDTLLQKAQLNAIEILKNTNERDAIPFIKKLLASESEDVRAHAYSFLISVDSRHATQHAKAAINDRSIKVRKYTYKTLIDKNILPPIEIIITARGDKDINLLKTMLIEKYPNNHATTYLTNKAIDSAGDIDSRLLAFRALIKRDNKDLARLPDKVYRDPNAKIRTYALKYWVVLNQNTPFLKAFSKNLKDALFDNNQDVKFAAIDAIASRHENWATQSLRDILLDSQTSVQTRKYIIESMTKHNNYVHATILIQLSKIKDDPLRIDALNALSAHNVPEVKNYLQIILRDSNQSELYHFTAAQALKNIDPKINISNYIISEF